MHSFIVVLLVGGLTISNPLKRIQEKQKEWFVPGFSSQNIHYFSPWTWTFRGPTGGEFINVLSHPNATNFALALSMADVWRTTNGGANWQLSFENCFPQNGVMSTPARGILIDGGGTVWITLDAGTNWANVLTTNGFQAGSFEVLDTVIYLVDSLPPRVLRSVNGGLSWQIMGTINSLYSVDQIAHIRGAPSWIWLTGHIQGDDTLTYILNSQDGGVTWTFIDTIIASEALDFQESPVNIWHTLISTDRGIYQATAGLGPWSLLNEPFAFGLYQSADIEFTGNDSIVVSSFFNQGIFRGRRSFGVWVFTQVENREIGTYMNFGGSTTLYCGSIGLGVFKSTNDGASWTIEKNGLYAHTIFSSGAATFSDSTFYFIGFGGTPYKTDNWGATWDSLPKNFLVFGSAIEVAPTNPNFLIASALDIQVVGATPRFLTIFRSTNGGTNWSEIDSTYMPNDFLITSDPNVIIGAVDTFLIRSTAGGNNFVPILEKASSFSNLEGCDTIFVAKYDSTFVSYNRGATWQGLIPFGGGELAYDNTRKLLFINNGSELLRYNLLSSVLDTLQQTFPITASVSPNGNLYFIYFPFGDTVPLIARSFDGGNTIEEEFFTIPIPLGGGLGAADNGAFFYQLIRGFWVSNDITYQIAETNTPQLINTAIFAPTIVRKGEIQKISLAVNCKENLSLILYDITGRAVKNIFNGGIEAGIHAFNFSTREISSGVYFILLSTKQRTLTVKQIIY